MAVILWLHPEPVLSDLQSDSAAITFCKPTSRSSRDIVIITAIVHVTGDLESNYFSLYLVTIILASILFPRGRAFLVAAVSFVFMGAMIELVYLPSMYPGTSDEIPRAAISWRPPSTLTPDLMTALQVKIGASFFGFFAVAYLSSYLAESLRKAGRELRDKSGQVASLQAKNENIIQSMREGLLSTDLEGKITELNPAGAEILGRQIGELRGGTIDTIFRGLADDILPAPGAASLVARQEITYLHPRPGAPHFGRFLIPACGARQSERWATFTISRILRRRNGARRSTAPRTAWRRWAAWRRALPTKSAILWLPSPGR